MFQTFFYGRYIIVLMGIFSIYTGFMYNDIFSKSMFIWKSGWAWPENPQGQVSATPLDRRYPFGLDPLWHGADNALIFINSYKMKMSIVIGVLHMTFAICLNVPNFIQFKQRRRIWAEFVPQILFMWCIFGYLILCILYKWATDWTKSDLPAPGLLNMLIYMFLSPGTVPEGSKLYAGQGFVQTILLLVALICVPWMLCTLPYLEWKEHKDIASQGYQGLAAADNGRASTDAELEDDEEGAGQPVARDEDEHHEFDMGEIVVHQVIHTIEFCLGCISNTASYLRLWALSLAHAQLSEVLWDMTMSSALGYSGGVIGGTLMLVPIFAMWFTLTICILCVMEGLSAFLHALRLHWVEFAGKFYQAGGYPFSPLTFVQEEEEME
jgi:V-type H+-transporting ATPase subunit a